LLLWPAAGGLEDIHCYGGHEEQPQEDANAHDPYKPLSPATLLRRQRGWSLMLHFLSLLRRRIVVGRVGI